MQGREKENARMYLEVDGRIYNLSVFEAKELYYKLRDVFDPNFSPSRGAPSVIVDIPKE